MTNNSVEIPRELTLTTPRLILRTPVELDEEAIRLMLSDVKTMKHLRFMAHEPAGWTASEVQERIKSQIEGQAHSERVVFHLVERSNVIEPEIDPLAPEGPKILRVSENLEDTKDIHTLVGSCGLHNINLVDMVAAMGIILHHPFQTKGYGTEALYLMLCYGFDVLHMHRVMVQTTKDNTGMRGWMENLCGVPVESVARETIRMNENTWLDSWDYAILEHEWRGSVKPRIEKKLGWKASF
ncbi:hypothetical protein K7432_008126 [Basidiobolus ranarum]|uniref:N-acetyltransferase domain-containing protein n=1 Tax=Basidiobolus ranarum TaxID=34480 RepID=A0ABR2VZ41_9FUNG